jgi:hypothetical protein
MREDHAQAGIAAGNIIVWNKEQLTTTLQFIFSTEHAHDLAIVALIETMRNIWPLDTQANNKSKMLMR